MRRWGWVCVLAATLAACKEDKPSTVPDAGPVETGPQALTEQEPNERPDQALTLTRDSTVTADLAAQPNKADEDWYKLAPSAPRIADVSVTGLPGGDITLEVYDQDRNRLAAVNSEGEGKPERFPNLYVDGARWVRVAPARKGVGGAYTLTVTMRQANDGEEHEPNDRAVDAVPLPLGQTVTAFLGHAGDEDWYRVELPESAPAPTGTPAAPGTETPASGTGETPPAQGTPPSGPETGAAPAQPQAPGSGDGDPRETVAEGVAPQDSTGTSPTGTFGVASRRRGPSARWPPCPRTRARRRRLSPSLPRWR